MKPIKISTFCLVLVMLVTSLVSCSQNPPMTPDETTTAAATTAPGAEETTPLSQTTEQGDQTTTMEPVNQTDPAARELFYNDNYAKVQ